MSSPAQLDPAVTAFRRAAFDFEGRDLAPPAVGLALEPSAQARAPSPCDDRIQMVRELAAIRAHLERLVWWVLAWEQRMKALGASSSAPIRGVLIDGGAHGPSG
jgi:hypothetical protein